MGILFLFQKGFYLVSEFEVCELGVIAFFPWLWLEENACLMHSSYILPMILRGNSPMFEAFLVQSHCRCKRSCRHPGLIG